jgi:GNAT superfamily N-acetyltransferase
MESAIRITPLTTLDAAIEPLLVEAEQQGFEFMRRLVEEWALGANRFDRQGERFLGAFGDGQLLGVGGLNRDPYANTDGVGRLRHLYVLASSRRLGVGSLLVSHILQDAQPSFRVVRLRTTTAEAAAFYLRLGFTTTDEKTASHVMFVGRGGNGATTDRFSE